jgi:hypothetical protein
LRARQIKLFVIILSFSEVPCWKNNPTKVIQCKFLLEEGSCLRAQQIKLFVVMIFLREVPSWRNNPTLTINVPLILKVRDNIIFFFAGKTYNGAFRGVFLGCPDLFDS